MSVNIFGSSGMALTSSNDKNVDQKFITLSTNLATKVNKAGDNITGDLNMSGNCIKNMREPQLDQDAATKIYVDTRSNTNGTNNYATKNACGLVPILISNINNKCGFNVTASEELNMQYEAHNVFNLYRINPWESTISSNFWIELQCPEPVKIHRLALRGKSTNTNRIFNWKFQASNNSVEWVDLHIATSTYIGNRVIFFNVTPSIAFSIYRLFIVRSEDRPCLTYMQIYTVDKVQATTPSAILLASNN